MFSAPTEQWVSRCFIPRPCCGCPDWRFGLHRGYAYILVRGHSLAVLLMLAPLGHAGWGAYGTVWVGGWGCHRRSKLSEPLGIANVVVYAPDMPLVSGRETGSQ